MKIAMVALSALVAGSAMGDGFFRDDCRHPEARNASTPATGITKVIIHAEAGALRVEGTEGARAFNVTGTACTSDEDLLERITLSLRKVGSELHIEANVPENRGMFGTSSASLDFTVTMPVGLPVVIDDESGSIEVSNSGSLVIDDDSGSIEVRGVRGNVLIDDDSGSISIDNVNGDVKIEDDSGSIDIRLVSGSVELEDDSGSISVADVRGSLHIRNDDSGSIAAQKIQRDVIIDRDGSGSIDVADIGGDFTVRRKTSGGIDHVRVAGKVDVPRRD